MNKFYYYFTLLKLPTDCLLPKSISESNDIELQEVNSFWMRLSD